MPLITSKIQNLLNGVSQQADTQRYPSQGDEQINLYSSPVEGLIKRNPTQHLAKAFASAAGLTDTYSHVINRDSTEQYVVNVRSTTKKTATWNTGTDRVSCTAHGFVAGDEVRFYGATLGTLNKTDRYYVISPTTNDFQVSLTSGGSAVDITDAGSSTQEVSLDPISVVDLADGSIKTITTTDDASYLVSTTPSTVYESSTIADYTFFVNNSVTVLEDTATYSNADYRAWVYIIQGDYGTVYTINLAGTDYSYTTGTTDRTQITTEYIATQLQTAVGSPTGFTISKNGSTLEFQHASDFTITTRDGLGDSAMGEVKDTADDFIDLPSHSRNGWTLAVTGDVESNNDDYYVKFTADDPSGAPFGKGTWAESAATGVKYQLDATTMPHVLIRNSDGTFTFKKATWDARTAGDAVTAPPPSFVGKKIKGLVLFRDRLGFLSGENVSLSESGEYFNFYRTTTVTSLGSDFLDVRASHNKVSNLHAAIPYNRNLILFSDRTQFMLTGGDVLSPDSISISQETEYETDPNSVPVVSGSNVYFPFPRGSYSGVMEYMISPETEQMQGIDTTTHIPKYIDGTIKRITSNSTDPVLVVTSGGYTTGVYVYAYYTSGNKKVQASWSKFDFGTDATIRSADFVGKTLILTVKRSDGLFIETLSFKIGEVDTDSDYTMRIDRRLTETDCSLSYDSDLDQTAVTLPFSASGTMQAISREVSSTENSGTIFPIVSQAGALLTVSGDLTSRKFWVGEQYSASFALSRPVLKEQSETGGHSTVTSGRYQIRNGTVSFDDTIFFKVEVTPEGRTTRTHIYDARTLGTSSFTVNGSPAITDGSFKFPVQSKGERVSIKLVNDSPFPSNFLTVEYEALYYSRSRRSK